MLSMIFFFSMESSRYFDCQEAVLLEMVCDSTLDDAVTGVSTLSYGLLNDGIKRVPCKIRKCGYSIFCLDIMYTR